MAKQKNNYVDKGELYTVMCEWKNQLKNDPNARIPEKLGEAILLIAHNQIRCHNTFAYTQSWKDEMIGDAIEYCCRYLHNFDTEKYTNVYGYISQICRNGFAQRIKIEKTNTAVKYKYFINEALDYENEDQDHRVDYDFYRQMLGRVDEYDSNRKYRREEKKEKLREKRELENPSQRDFNVEDFF